MASQFSTVRFPCGHDGSQGAPLHIVEQFRQEKCYWCPFCLTVLKKVIYLPITMFLKPTMSPQERLDLQKEMREKQVAMLQFKF